ncbi:hypothetical protein SPLC1_S541030 [Arthrospira platensis C1]|nr:hypothetical protein SPLC1_S541030 [Arthrospira platensis C1]
MIAIALYLSNRQTVLWDTIVIICGCHNGGLHTRQ